MAVKAATVPAPNLPAHKKCTRRRTLAKDVETLSGSATQTASGRLRRKRTKTFTGCWTCRARKVKCDEARPHCMACRKSDLSCEGYSVRLLWLSDGYQSNELSKRRSSLSDKERWLMTLDLYQHDSNLDDYLDRLDETIPHVETVSLGPFSVFNSCIYNGIKPENTDAPPFSFMSAISSSEPLAPFEDLPSLEPSWISSRPPIKNHDSYLSIASSNSSSGSSESSPISFDESTPIFSADTKVVGVLPDICEGQNDNNQLSVSMFQEDLSIELSEMSDLWSPRFTWIGDLEGDSISNAMLQKDISRDLESPPNEVVRLSNSFPQFSPTPSTEASYLSTEIELWAAIDLQTADIQKLRDAIFGNTTSSCISFGDIPLSMVCVNSSMNNSLMQFYSSAIVKRMQPISHQKNPWRTLYLSKAMQGVGEVASFGSCSDSKASLFYSLMAVAAYTLSLRPLAGAEESLFHCKVGHVYRAISLRLIRHTMEDNFFGAKYKETLMALLSTVTVAVFSGRMDGTPEYLAMCERFIKTRGTNKKRSSKANVLHQIFYALRLIRVSTAIIPMPISDDMKEELAKADFREAGEQGESAVWTSNNTFEVCYCITPSLLDMIVDTVQLAGHLKYYACNGDSAISSLLTQRAEKLESRLKNWSLHIDKTYTVIMADAASKEIFSLHARAFHQSLCIYFARVIKGTHPELLQNEVEKSIIFLEKMASSKCESTPVLWCAFISGCEALNSDLQARFINYIDKIASYSPGNIHTLREILQEIWKRRKQTQNPEYSWESLLKESSRVVLFS